MSGFPDPSLDDVSLDESGRRPGINPNGVLGGVDLRIDPDASAKAFANGTHILSPQTGEAIDVSYVGVPHDTAKGVKEALDVTGTSVDTTHGVVDQVGRFLPGDHSVLRELPKVTRAITWPLAIGGGVAGAVSDIHNGVPADIATIGNATRTGLVIGAGLLGEIGGPLVGAGAAWAADRFLPDSATIGKGVRKIITAPPDSSFPFPM